MTSTLQSYVILYFWLMSYSNTKTVLTNWTALKITSKNRQLINTRLCSSSGLRLLRFRQGKIRTVNYLPSLTLPGQFTNPSSFGSSQFICGFEGALSTATDPKSQEHPLVWKCPHSCTMTWRSLWRTDSLMGSFRYTQKEVRNRFSIAYYFRKRQ